MINAGDVTITNHAGASIAGSQMGIMVLGGNTTLTNNGTITGSGGTAVLLNNDYNTVTLGTGSVINGNIVVGNAADAYLDALQAEIMSTTPTGLVVDKYANNNIYLDGEGVINADQINGFNSLTKTGTGTWVLAGDQDFTYYNTTMPIAVNNGVLALESRNTSAGVTASSFTQAVGSGLGYIVTASATPVAPVSATGALTVTGNANFNNGTIYVIPLAGDYAATTTYERVLAVGGTIVTPWSSVVSTSALLTPTMVEEAPGSKVYDLVLERESFTTGASGGNVGLGADLDQLYKGATGDLRTILDEIVLMPTIGDVQKALTEVSGGTHTAFQLMSFSGLGKYLGVLNNHIGGGTGIANSMGRNSWYADNYPQGVQLAMAGNGSSMSDAAPVMLAMAGNLIGQGQIASGTNWGIWADGYASIGNRRSDDIIAKYKQTLYGGMMGFDVRAADNLFIGISGGVSTTDLTFDDMMDNGNMDSYHGSFYVVYDGKPFYAEGVVTYARNKYDLERYITMGPAIAKSDYSGNEYVGYAEVGYKLDAGGVIIRPLAAFQADYLSQEAFTETGAGIYNLSVEKRNTGSYQSFLGVNVSGPIKMGASAVLTPELRLKWAHEFSNEEHLITARFAGDSSGSFTVGPEALSRDTAIVGAGLNLSFNKNVSAYIQYDAELNKDFINHTGLLGIRFNW
jgi:outer membrane autotransporter protein